MPVSLDPAVLLLLTTAGGLYVRALMVLRRRGVSVPRWQQTGWWTGLGCFAVALLGPLDVWGEQLFSAHMGQHLLIADVGAPLLIAGLRWPVLVFFVPRPALVALARRRRLRAVLGVLHQPLVAICVYVAILYFWHFTFSFEAAVRSDLVHGLQHQSFVLGSLLVWWAALDPGRRRVQGELWKIGHILGARLPGMLLGMAFIVVRVPIYTGAYGGERRPFGFTAIADQQLAGGLMLGLDFFVTLFALSFFFWRAAADHDRTEQAQSQAAMLNTPTRR